MNYKLITHFITALLTLYSCASSKKKQEYIVQYVSDSLCNEKTEIFAVYPLGTCTTVWTGSQPPSIKPTRSPTTVTTHSPIDHPSALPTKISTIIPTTTIHTSVPSIKPSILPSTPDYYTSKPSISPTSSSALSATPTVVRSAAPSAAPSTTPTVVPSAAPSATPTVVPSAAPSATPTVVPSAAPSATPTVVPSAAPSATPTVVPSAAPSATPTVVPSAAPSATPTVVPSAAPSATPSSTYPTTVPTATPSFKPTTNSPTSVPTSAPSSNPSISPTVSPAPSATPTIGPSFQPTQTDPSAVPSANPSSVEPTTVPSAVPSITNSPTDAPTSAPSVSPSISSTSSPVVSNSQKICQNSGYCRSDSDCVPGNRCNNPTDPYFSQCQADSTTYLTSNCVSNYGHCADSSAVCCDPGSQCNGAAYSQCVQPTATLGQCMDPPNFPSTPPTYSPSVAPTISIAPTGSPKICQNSGYCRTDSDCVPGNKCNVQNAYFSQCQADSSTYLTSNCVSNFGHCADHTAVCCDPGSHCNGAEYSQCVQPTATLGQCLDPPNFPSAPPTFSPSQTDPSAVPSAKPSSIEPTNVAMATPSFKPITYSPTDAPTSAPSSNPSISSTSSPVVSYSQKICQNSGYCRSDSDCVPGNRCNNPTDPYFSQCLADSTTYLTSNCVSNYGHCADSSAVCCDPGSQCNGAAYSQCVQPTATLGQCMDPPNFPSTPPTYSPSVAPTISIAPTGSPKICQNGGYCHTDSDCVPGNKCNVQNAFYSQCQADSSTYLTSNCVSNFGHCADHTAVCCDPGSHCNGAAYSQCVQPSPPACTNPNGFSQAAVVVSDSINPYDLNTAMASATSQARTARIEMAVGVDNSYELHLTYFQDSSCAIRSSVESAEMAEGRWCIPYNGMPKLLSVYEHSVPEYHGIVMQLFASTSPNIDSPVNSALVEPIATMVKHPLLTCQPYSNPSTPMFKSSSLRRCWVQGNKIYAAWKFYFSSGCKGVSESVSSRIVGPTTTQYDLQSQTSYYLACV